MLLYLEDMKKYGVKFTQPGGGFNFWIKLPTGMDANKLYYHTAKRGVVFIPGSVFSYERSSISANYARLSFAQTDKADIKYGMTVIDDYIKKSAKGYRSANKVYPLV